MHGSTRVIAVVVLIAAVCGCVWWGYNHLRPLQGANRKTVRLGESFTIELEENPSTGYAWSLEFDPAKLQLISDHSGAPSTPMPGAPSKHTWEFRAIAQGRTTIKFSYVRAWQPQQPDRVVEYDVRIK